MKTFEELEAENRKLRISLSQIAHIVGGAVLTTASIEFLTEKIEVEVKFVVTELQADNEHLRKRIEKLSKRKPTKEEAVAQYHWLKENSSRNKKETRNLSSELKEGIDELEKRRLKKDLDLPKQTE